MYCLPELVAEMWQRAKNVKVILMDVDGVLTNMEIAYSSAGKEIKYFNAHDGLGIRLVHEAGLKTGLISARESEAIRIRAKELGIHFLYLGKYDKLKSYEELKKQTGLKDENFCFIADDLPDIPVLFRAGFPVAVGNASLQAKETARFITKRDGGRGAVREVMEFILHTQGKLEHVLDYVARFDQNKQY